MRLLLVCGCGALLALIACSDVTTNLVSDRRDEMSPPKAKDAGRPPLLDAAIADSGVGTVAMCGKRACACNNAEDDDLDRLDDGFDPECTGPFDDDESSFAVGKMPGMAAPAPACRGCFWNPKPGKAGDDCRYASECLEGRTPVDGTPACTCEVSDACQQRCLERTPNGCDCFGCCEVTRDDGSRVEVLLNERCSLLKVDDPAACPACVKSSLCRNDCGACELCPGRTEDELPAPCVSAVPSGQAPRNACDEGQQACGPNAVCAADYYCQLGCCLYVVP